MFLDTYQSDYCIIYEGVSKIFRTGATIYTAVVVAQSTGRWYEYHVQWVSVPSCT
jgi:hypothetical protein